MGCRQLEEGCSIEAEMGKKEIDRSSGWIGSDLTGGGCTWNQRERVQVALVAIGVLGLLFNTSWHSCIEREAGRDTEGDEMGMGSVGCCCKWMYTAAEKGC